MKNVPFKLEKFWIFFSSFFRKSYKANCCGHKTKRKGFMKVDNENTIMTIPLAKNGNPDYCIECIGNMSIKCAWCNNTIIIGSPVTLYTPVKSFEVPDHAVVYKKDPLQLVGCLGWECADTGADRSGFWLPGVNGEGQVTRVPSPIEMLMSSSGDSSLIINDLSDIEKVANPDLFPIDSKN